MPAPTEPPSPVADSLLDLIGATPMLELRTLPGADAARVLVKCEQWNPGGSVMDRTALALIEAAEAAGAIRPGVSTIVEATSGNTGIGLAMVCAIKGYRLLLAMPESMSLERRALLAAYGAEVVLTEAERAMEGAIERASALCAGTPGGFMPRQFENPANPAAHRRTTALEILAQCEGALDAFVVGVGTGGTLAGVGAVLRERLPAARLVAVEPAGASVLAGGPAGPHRLQGIGAGFVPPLLAPHTAPHTAPLTAPLTDRSPVDRSLVDEVVAVTDRDAHETQVLLARREGLLAGISGGAAVFAACAVARRLGPGRSVVTVVGDSGERDFSLAGYFA